jgi:hypothetical protein
MPKVKDSKTGEVLMEIAYDDKGYWQVLARKVIDIMGAENVEIEVEKDYERPDFGKVEKKESSEKSSPAAPKKAGKQGESSEGEESSESSLGGQSAAPSSDKRPKVLPELQRGQTETSEKGPAVPDGQWKRPSDY